MITELLSVPFERAERITLEDILNRYPGRQVWTLGSILARSDEEQKEKLSTLLSCSGHEWNSIQKTYLDSFPEILRQDLRAFLNTLHSSFNVNDRKKFGNILGGIPMEDTVELSALVGKYLTPERIEAESNL